MRLPAELDSMSSLVEEVCGEGLECAQLVVGINEDCHAALGGAVGYHAHGDVGQSLQDTAQTAVLVTMAQVAHAASAPNSIRSSTMAARRLSSSMVTLTATSEVAMISMEVRWFSKVSNTLCRKP